MPAQPRIAKFEIFCYHVPRMRISIAAALLIALAALAYLGLRSAPEGAHEERAGATKESTRAMDPAPQEDEEEDEEAKAARIAREYPIEGVVRYFQLAIREEPRRDSRTLGFIRRNTKVRARTLEGDHPGCSNGYLELYPKGYACAGTEILIDEEGEIAEEHRVFPPPDSEHALPYDYYFVTMEDAPVMKRFPRNYREREAVLAYVRRLRHFKRNEPEKLDAFLEDEIEDEPRRPWVIDRFLARGYYISGPREVDDGKRYVRNAQGEVLFADALMKIEASEHQGVHLGGDVKLPLGFVARPGRPSRIVKDEEGNEALVDDEEAELYGRYHVLHGSTKREQIGRFLAHRIDDEWAFKEWFVAHAERIDPPNEVGHDEIWIHVDLSEQTLVVYRGAEPIFATLVSTGVEDHATPPGLFRIDKKFVGRTMNDVSPDTPRGDQYRIEDVPYTQYYQGSYAIHAAFWHDRLGIPRSHGCVNLSPHDAMTVFNLTGPELPTSWFGIYDDPEDETGSWVYLTE